MGCGASKNGEHQDVQAMRTLSSNPNARKRNRRSSLKPLAEIEQDKMKPYVAPLKRFMREIHFPKSGDETQIPWTAVRRAVLYQWVCTSFHQPGLGLLPQYVEKETALSFKGLNSLRQKLDLPALDYHNQTGSEVVTLKRAMVEELVKSATVLLTECEGAAACAEKLTDDDKTREGLMFESLFPDEDKNTQEPK